MLDAVERNLGAAPERALADAGYRGEEVFEQLHSRPTRCLVALGREGREQLQIDAAEYPHTAQMAVRLDSQDGEAAYRRRKAIAQAPNGWIKHVLGFRQFSLRGLDKARGEWKLVCLALNLRRMCTLVAA